MRDVSSVILSIQKDRLPAVRIQKRKEWEDQAAEIITKNIGKLTKDHIEGAMKLLDADFWSGSQIIRRFGLTLWGRNPKLILQSSEKDLNLFFSEVFDKENIDDVEGLTLNIKGAGDGFVSCILYLKNRETYNVFVGATEEGIKTAFPDEAQPLGSFKTRYLHFNELANKLKNKYNLKAQEMDVILTDLSGWTVAQSPEKEIGETPAENLDPRSLNHETVEGLLIELGNLLGYKTFVADPSKPYKGKMLGDYATLEDIPSFTYERILRTVREIDVIWFEDEFPVDCFEVEHSTGVTKGLLRLYQLKSLSPRFFIVAPEEVKSKFENEVDKAPHREIRDRYRFKSYETLVNFYKLSTKYQAAKKNFFE